MTLVLLVYFLAGNICRSPTAEAVFRNMVNKRELTEHVSFMFLFFV